MKKTLKVLVTASVIATLTTMLRGAVYADGGSPYGIHDITEISTGLLADYGIVLAITGTIYAVGMALLLVSNKIKRAVS